MTIFFLADEKEKGFYGAKSASLITTKHAWGHL